MPDPQVIRVLVPGPIQTVRVDTTTLEAVAAKNKARDWAIKTDGPVEGGEFSAKYWATQGDVGTIADNIAAITAVAAIDDEIVIVAGMNPANIAAVAAIDTEITTVAGIASDVSTVAGLSDEIATVIGLGPDITTVAGIAADVTAVAANNADISIVADNIGIIQEVAGYPTGFATAEQGALADGAMQKAANGSDIVNPATFRTNLSVYSIAGADLADAAWYGAAVQRSNHTGTQPAATITGLATVATSGAYNDLSGKPTLGTAAAQNTSAFATAAQGTTADSALQPGAIGSTVQAYSAKLASLAGLSLVAGDIFYATGANAIQRLAKGTDGQFLSLVSGVPAWANSGGGAIIPSNVVTAIKTDTFSTTSTSFVDVTGLSVSITPTSASSRILVMAMVNAGPFSGSTLTAIKVIRGSTDFAIGDAASNRIRTSTIVKGLAQMFAVPIIAIDSPATTSATTYKVQISTSSSTTYVNRDSTDTDAATFGRGISSITVMEIV